MWPYLNRLVVIIKGWLLCLSLPFSFAGLIDLELVRSHGYEESSMRGVHWLRQCYPKLVLMPCYVSEFMREPIIFVRWTSKNIINFGLIISPPVQIHLILIDFLNFCLSETITPERYRSINYKIECFIDPIIPIRFDFPFTGRDRIFPGCLHICLFGGCLCFGTRDSLHLSFYELHFHGPNLLVPTWSDISTLIRVKSVFIAFAVFFSLHCASFIGSDDYCRCEGINCCASAGK